MGKSMVDPLLLLQEAAANYPSPDPWEAESTLEEVMSSKNDDNVGAAENSLEDQQWVGKADLLRADDMEDLFDFSGLE